MKILSENEIEISESWELYKFDHFRLILLNLYLFIKVGFETWPSKITLSDNKVSKPTLMNNLCVKIRSKLFSIVYI